MPLSCEENLRLIREIEANREFILTVYRQNPALLARAEQRICDLFGIPDKVPDGEGPTRKVDAGETL